MKLKIVSRLTGFCVVGALSMLLTATAQAADVTFVGSATTSDYSDAGSDLGNEGYWFANFDAAAGVNDAPADQDAADALPAYTTVTFGSTVDSAGGWGGYADLTLPDGTVGNSGALETNSDGTGPGPGVAGDQFEFLTLTFGAGSPESLFVGLVADSSDGAQWSPTEILAGGVSTGALGNDLAPDVHTFRIDNITAGDSVQIDGILRTDNQVAHLGGVLIDVIPEPASFVMLGMGGLLSLMLRRR